MWQCVKCSEKHKDLFEYCWNCGSSRDGVEDPSFRKADDIPLEPNAAAVAEVGREITSQRPLMCLRCNSKLDYIGTKSFHEGTRWGILGDLGELFVHKERFDVYCCPGCGRVEFFVDGVGDEFRPQEED
jgi:hypothetical protein